LLVEGIKVQWAQRIEVGGSQNVQTDAVVGSSWQDAKAAAHLDMSSSQLAISILSISSSDFLSAFPDGKLKLFPSPVDGCLQEHGEERARILPVQTCINQLHGFCVNRSTASAVANNRIYSHWLQRYEHLSNKDSTKTSQISQKMMCASILP